MRTPFCAAVLLLAGCQAGQRGSGLTLAQEGSPAPPGSVLPQLSPAPGGGVMLSWLEPRADSGYRFRMAIRRDSAWSEVRTIAEGKDILKFTADLYSVTAIPGGGILANWEVSASARNPWASRMLLATSQDEGRTWSEPVIPHRDRSAGEHSFASTFVTGEGVGLVWLDARNRHESPPMPGMMHGGASSGAIGLYYAAINADGTVQPDQAIDSVTCECCPTAAALSASGPLVVYRNRSAPPPDDVAKGRDSVVRDIYLARLEAGRWSQPRRVHADEWVFNGCPDNGPSIDTRRDTVVVAWWTGAGGSRNVRVAFSFDGGDTFGPPIRGDDGDAEGQVTVALAGSGTVLGWLEGGTARARSIGFDGQRSAPLILGAAPGHSRLSRWLPDQNGVLAVWTSQEKGDLRQVRVGRLSLGGQGQ